MTCLVSLQYIWAGLFVILASVVSIRAEETEENNAKACK